MLIIDTVMHSIKKCKLRLGNGLMSSSSLMKILGSRKLVTLKMNNWSLCVKFLVDNGTNAAFPFMSNSLFAAGRLFCFQNKSL